MRIAVINWSRRRVGGTETYLGLIIPELARLGHEMAFWHEIDRPSNREQIELPEGVPAWCVEHMGQERALGALRAWQPDLIYTHSLLTPELEKETLKIAPAIFFAHAYYGTCISGAKTLKSPEVTPCSRRFGWKCLVHYYPRRCGGLNPFTMLKLYGVQSKRLRLLQNYAAILTHSSHMRDEYLAHGLPDGRVHNLSYYAHSAAGKRHTLHELLSHADASGTAGDVRTHERAGGNSGRSDDYHLLFAGRMDRLKGGHTFLEALPRVAARLDRPLYVTFAGDGPERRALERAARRLEKRSAGLRINFTGWAARERLNLLLDSCDLLVLPSLWPEPFGLAGPEAGLHGVPVAAFAVGGIPDWLIDGVNGHLAPGDPPTAEGLAEAIVKCLSDPATHARLSRGAVEVAQRFSLQNHMTALLEIFDAVLGRAPSAELAGAAVS